MNLFRSLPVLLAVALLMVATPSRAVPSLQLDIYGGSYDASSETVMASGNTFSVYAYGLVGSVSLVDDFFLSIALVPPTSTAGDYGSFSMNGTTFNVTADMTYGVPPLETILGGAGWDSGDLSKHSVFPTYFAEAGFNFSADDQSAVYNTADNAGQGPQSGSGMYFKKLDFDISGLSAGYGLHFDLYNVKIKTSGDIDRNLFAPFSHDAEAMVTAIPEPEIYAMMGLGLGLMGFVARRRKQNTA